MPDSYVASGSGNLRTTNAPFVLLLQCLDVWIEQNLSLQNYTFQIVDENSGETLGPHQRGEICLKAPSICKGYLNNPKANAEAFDSDGWLHMGKTPHHVCGVFTLLVCCLSCCMFSEQAHLLCLLRIFFLESNSQTARQLVKKTGQVIWMETSETACFISACI